MTKVLFYGEPPMIETGLAQVGKQHIKTFQALGWDIHAVCINMFHKEYDHTAFPFPIEACSNIGEAYNRDNMKRAIRHGDYDVIFLSADCGNVDVFIEDILYMRGQKKFIVVSYVPVDCDIIGPQPFRIFSVSDLNYTYSEHAKRTLSRIVPNALVKVIPLGVDTETFHVMEPERRRKIRKRLWGIDDDFFVCLNVARNQWRKDLTRCMYGFHLFHQDYPHSLLYMNSKQTDIGGNLPTYAEVFGLYTHENDPRSNTREIYFPHEGFTDTAGVNVEVLNELYNIADCYISSSTGEGWGLPIHEAMACHLPVLVPFNTAHLDLVGKNHERGFYISCGGPDHWIMPYGYTNNPRDIISCTSLRGQLEYIYHNRMEARDRADRAYVWAHAHTWEHFQVKWQEELKCLTTSDITV